MGNITSIAAVLKEYNKATKCLTDKKVEKASIAYRKILRQVEFKEVWLNLGNCYRLQGEYEKAKIAYTNANKEHIPHIDSRYVKSYPLALSNLGLLHYSDGDDDLANKCYEEAIALDPEYWDAIWNKASSTLRIANNYEGSTLREDNGREVRDPNLLHEGWGLYTYRFKRNNPVQLKNNRTDLLVWNYIDKVPSIVVLAEQGLGDAIMFGRYLPLLKNFTNKIYIQCDPQLDIFFQDYNICRDTSQIMATHAIPLCSLGQLCDYIPSEKYLPSTFYEKKEAKFIFPDVDTPNRKYRIGIVFAGSSSHANNHNRSVSVDRFKRFSNYATLYSLTPGFSGNKYVQACPCKTWEDTCTFLKELDLVISVDTSVVHVCGTLGVDCWMLQPHMETDFRWGNSREITSKNVWYSSVTVFNNPGSWDLVFQRVENALKARL